MQIVYETFINIHVWIMIIVEHVSVCVCLNINMCESLECTWVYTKKQEKEIV